jgi:hypothetical protein
LILLSTINSSTILTPKKLTKLEDAETTETIDEMEEMETMEAIAVKAIEAMDGIEVTSRNKIEDGASGVSSDEKKTVMGLLSLSKAHNSKNN